MNILKNKNLYYLLLLCIKPREAVKKILNTPNKGITYLLIINFGIVISIYSVVRSFSSFHMTITSLLIICVLQGVVIGIVWYFGASGIYKLIGSWFGGKGSYRDIRLALAYSSIPLVFLSGVWILTLLTYGIEKFTIVLPYFYSFPFGIEESILQLHFSSPLLMIIAIVTIITTIWYGIIIIQCLSEAHQFSSIKGLIVLLIPLLLISIIKVMNNLSY
jgi:hypothetical protein